MKYLFICLAFILNSCQQNADDRLEKELKKHLQPRDSILNKIAPGETIALSSSERQGVNLEKFKEYDFWKDIDKHFFEFADSKEFSDPDESGGISTTIEIFKAVKKGYTEIKFYKRKYYGNKNIPDSIQKDTTAILYNIYKFNIE